MLQLILADLALLSRSDTPTIISLVGNMVLYVICGLIGALTVAPYKYMWWVASLIFLIIVFMLLLQRLNNAEGYGGDALKGLTWLTILVWLVYPIVWIAPAVCRACVCPKANVCSGSVIVMLICENKLSFAFPPFTDAIFLLGRVR